MHDDVSAFSQILYRYWQTADRRDIDEIVSLFAPDGAVVIRGVAHVGHDPLVALYQAWAESQPVGAVQRHHVTSPVITVAEDTATCREIGIEAHIALDAPAAIAHVTWDR